MFTFFSHRILLASLLLALVSTAFAQSRRGYVRLTRIGPTVLVEDNVSKQITREFSEQPTEEVRILENNTVITTGDNSRVILVFSNGATVTVKEKSRINIIKFRQDPFEGSYDPKSATNEPAATSRTEIFLKEGELVGNVKKLNPESVFTVSTPAGAAGIRGTTFRVVFRPTGTGQAFFTVTTLEGDVGVTTSEGSVDAPIGVLDDQEIAILVEVDDATGEVTVVTPIADIVTGTADPVVLADMTQAVQESVEAVVNIVITADTDQDNTPIEDESAGPPESEGDVEEESESQEEPSSSTETEDGTPAGENTESSEGDGGTPQPPAPPVVKKADGQSPTQGGSGG